MLRLTTAIIIATYMLLNSCSVIATNTIETTTHTTGEISLVLMGLVVDENNQKPINAATIVLIDQEEQTKLKRPPEQEPQTEQELKVKERFETTDDGTFQFKLEAGKSYEVLLIDALGKIIDKKTVSTVNKSEAEIMHTMFEINKYLLDSDMVIDR